MSVYKVTGMSCAACSQRVEKATMKVEGVESCAVSLLTNSMRVEGNAREADIINAVKKVGYGISKETDNYNINSDIQSSDDGNNYDNGNDHDNDNNGNYGDIGGISEEKRKLKLRLISSIGLTVVLMYVSMGHMMWGWPLPAFFNDNHVGVGILQMVIAIAVMIINGKFFINGFRGLVRKSPNMDTLVALGSGASFVYSMYALFMMTRALTDAHTEFVMSYMDEFYFESAATILTLITVGKTLEARAKGKTTDALKSLIGMKPKYANVENDGEIRSVPISKVKVGDIFLVKPGESIPVDGIVIDGASSVNEAVLTGESMPAYKQKGDTLSQATINQTGFIKGRATRVGADTTLSQIINLVKEASATKAPIAKIADKISGMFVPAVISIAIVTFIAWIVAGEQIGYALARAVSVLVISCPCALGLATPVAIMVGNGIGARNGVLFKNAVALEETGKTQIVVLDKTGTITKGEPVVTDVIASEELIDLLEVAYSLEKKSEHPLAKAVIKYCEERKINEISTINFDVIAGNGLKGEVDGGKVYGGNFVYVDNHVTGHISEDMKNIANKLSKDGKTPLYFAKDGKLLGIIAAMDVLKEDAREGIKELMDMGIRVVMATGDNKVTAEAVAKNAGIDYVVAGVMPKDKNILVNELKTLGKVAMVGDGINDALALTNADTGIAIGSGTDVAIDAANVVLMKSSIKDVSMAIRMSRETLKNIRENLFWAFIYNIIGIPLAAGVYIPIFGWKLNPMFGALAMGLSSFCVVSNALRLNLKNMKNKKYDKKVKNDISKENISSVIKEMEETKMTKTMKIEGMMCGHCEAAVKKALEGIEGVSEVVVSYETGTAKVTIEGDVSDELLTKTVEDKDYKVTGIE